MPAFMPVKVPRPSGAAVAQVSLGSKASSGNAQGSDAIATASS